MSFKDLNLDKGSDKFFKVADGQNKVRIMSDPTEVWVSFDKETKKAQKYLDQSLALENPGAKKRYGMWVIDRADGKVKMAEWGTSIMTQIQILSHDDDYGFEGLPPYDIKITRAGSGMETKYTVTPLQKTELMEDEKLSMLNIESVADFLKKQPGLITQSETLPF